MTRKRKYEIDERDALNALLISSGKKGQLLRLSLFFSVLFLFTVFGYAIYKTTISML